METLVQIKVVELCKLLAVEEALVRLRSELPSYLTYHAYPHTLDVISEAVRLACADNRSPREVEIVGVAAAWHDIGFTKAAQNNEPIAAAAASEFLTSLGAYTPDEISLIAQMILDTAMKPHGGSFKQIPATPLSPYLLDADLANFGRDDFFEKSELQRREVGENEEVFRVKTLALLKNHSWLTPAAKKFWQESKEKNVIALEKKVSQKCGC